MRLFLLTLALITGPALAAPSCSVSDLPRIAGKSYHVARGLLIDSGARPTLRKQNPDVRPAVDDLALGYAEVCDTGNQSSTYAWATRNGQPFTVTLNHLGRYSLACGLSECP